MLGTAPFHLTWDVALNREPFPYLIQEQRRLRGRCRSDLGAEPSNRGPPTLIGPVLTKPGWMWRAHAHTHTCVDFGLTAG